MKNKKYSIFVLLVILSIGVMAISSGYFTQKEKTLAYEKAKVIEVVENNIQRDELINDLSIGYQQLHVEVITGEFKGQRYYVKNPMSRLYNIEGDEDQTLVVRLVLNEGQLENISIFNYHRAPVLYGLLILFFLLLIILGGMKGFRSALSLVFTGSTIVFFMLPMLFKGYNPITLSILTVTMTTIVSLILVSHWHKKTLAAICGTLAGVLMAGLLAFLSSKIAHLSGITMDEAEELLFIAGDRGIQVTGLMFSAILIASLGAVMDVAMSIASAIFEIAGHNKDLTQKELFKSGMNVGKDVMGTMANTLILAFAGGALNVMILIAAYEMPYHQLMNLDFIGTEGILSLSGSIGIVLTVPLTALVSARLARFSK
jgi:uncharacterized membrane protein